MYSSQVRGVSQVVLVIKNLPASAGDIMRHGFSPWVGKIPWRKVWQPTPVFLPGEFHGQRCLEVYSPWGCKDLDITKETLCAHTYFTTIKKKKKSESE